MLAADRPGLESVWWRDLKKALIHSPQGQIINSDMRWKVGCGDQTKFWEDKWVCGEMSLAEKFPRLYSISLQQQSFIQQMGSLKDNGWEWNFTLRRLCFDDEIDSAAVFLNKIQDMILPHQGPDVWEWTANSTGQYTANSAYKVLMEGAAAVTQEDCFAKLWSIKVPSKIAIFAWRLIRDRLPTRHKLQRRQVQVADTSCPLCRVEEENAGHLFFHCSKIQPLWWEAMSWINIKGAAPLTPKMNFNQHMGLQADGVRSNRWQCWWMALTWSIWKTRNSIVFSNGSFNANKLFEDAVFILWTWLRNYEKGFKEHFNQWSNSIRQAFLYQ